MTELHVSRLSAPRSSTNDASASPGLFDPELVHDDLLDRDRHRLHEAPLFV
jgi:hypothetical protein